MKELDDQAAIVRRVADEVFAARGRKVRYLVGTMIEVPRGALTADEIARTAEFFSFGTNDLTQTTFGLSRDDTGPVLADLRREGDLPVDPFVSIDREGVGRSCGSRSRAAARPRPGLKLGICGEHGGDPSSVAFCHELGLDYVSCSPYRLPIARLAAAQAALRERARGEPRGAPAEGARRARRAPGARRPAKAARGPARVREGEARAVAVAPPRGRPRARAPRARSLTRAAQRGERSTVGGCAPLPVRAGAVRPARPVF